MSYDIRAVLLAQESDDSTLLRLTGSPALGFKLCEWHGGGSSAVHIVGSAFIAGHMVGPNIADVAVRELRDTVQEEREANLWAEAAQCQEVMRKLALLIKTVWPWYADLERAR